ncbi:MAG: hypothetical protein WA323_02405 [Candidatus Nitrosopolaris sp.]
MVCNHLLKPVNDNESVIAWDSIPTACGSHGSLNRLVRYAIESATANYPIIVMKLAIVEAMKAW